MTCQHRPCDWQAASKRSKLPLLMQRRLRCTTRWVGSGRIYATNTVHGRAPENWAECDRSRQAREHTFLSVDAHGIPFAFSVRGTNCHNSMAFESTLCATPAVRRPIYRPRKLPAKLHADKGYELWRDSHRLSMRQVGIPTERPDYILFSLRQQICLELLQNAIQGEESWDAPD